MGEYANYYNAESSNEFKIILKEFLEKLDTNSLMNSADRKTNTWRKSAQTFIDFIL